ncbi:MAG: hypothetical protein HY300_01270 [Verrucomicrobia bacterium]|nr:hypothetical protein [Verrucomicrobiota bacterium]
MRIGPFSFRTVICHIGSDCVGGGNSSVEDFTGASVTATATLTGNFNFHYDENLARVGPTRAYVVTSWNEI